MFGSRLRKLRKDKELTQKELGEIIGVSGRVVGYYESDDRFPDGDTLAKIANYFKVTIDYLLGRTDIRTPEPETIAAHHDGDEFTEEELEEIERFKEFVRMRRKDKKDKK